MPLPVGSYGAGPYGAGAYGYGASPPIPPGPGPPVPPGTLPYPHPEFLRELYINCITALGMSFEDALTRATLEELLDAFAHALLNFQLSVVLPYYTVGPGQGMVNDSGLTDNSPIIDAAFATARTKGYGGIHLLPGYIPNGWYGMDVDVPDGMGIIGAGDGGDMTNPGSTNPSTAYSGTIIGPCTNARGVAPLRLSGAGSTADNLICVGSAPGHTTGTFPLQSFIPAASSAPSVGYALLVNGHGARATRVACIGGNVAALGFDSLATAILNASLIDVTCLNPFNPQPYSCLPDRVDTCSWTATVPTVFDPAISALDVWSPVVGLPGTAQAYVSPEGLVPGVSFCAMNPQGDIVAPASGTGGSLSIKRFRSGAAYLCGMDVLTLGLRTYAGGVYLEGNDATFVAPRFSPSGQTDDVVVAASGRVTFVAPVNDFGAYGPASGIVRRGTASISISSATLESTATGPTLGAYHDANAATGQSPFTIRGVAYSGSGSIPSVLDSTGGYPAGSILENVNVATGALSALYTNGLPGIVRSNLIGGVFQLENPSGSAAVPIGSILPYGGTSVPANFLACNGAAVSRTTYAALFAAVGTAFGAGDGTTTFNLPSLGDSYLRGAGSVPVGTLGGANTKILAAANIPLLAQNTGATAQSTTATNANHYHTVPGSEFVIGITSGAGYFINTPGGSPGVNTVSFNDKTDGTGGAGISVPITVVNPPHAHSFQIGSVSPSAFNVEPKNTAVSYIIRSS